MGIRPGLSHRKAPAVSLVQDQDVYIADADKADLTITVIGAIEDNGIKHVTDIQVTREVCSKSRYLRPIIDASEDPTEITLGGELKRSGTNKHGQHDFEDLEGLLIVLAHLHGLNEQKMEELGLYRISVSGMWYAIAYSERDLFGSAKETLGPWFAKWYSTSMEGVQLTVDSARSLAMPCQLFNHADGFARVTKWLAYNHIGHVKERPPKGFKGHKGLHMPPGEFVGPVNHARGGLKTTLHRSLYKKCGRILRYDTKKCNCWDSTVGRYFYALTKIDVFPVEDVISRSSIQQIINRFDDFNYTHMPACIRCRQIDWDSVVLEAKANTEVYFDGLCLDCMDRSRSQGKSLDNEYWKHNKSVGGRWDTPCRIAHDQSTWYVSWLGRPDVREKIMRGQDTYRDPEEA